MYAARRPIVVPASMFSLVASSMKPSGAITRMPRAAISSALATPSTPPK